MDELEYERRLTEAEQRSKSNTKRLEDLEKRQDNLDELTISVAKLAEREQHMENDVKEIKSDVKTLTGKSGKLWDSLSEKVILTLAAALIGYVLAQMGIGA